VTNKSLELSVVIITKNEAGNISGALDSVSWIDDVVVVDSGSTDDTLAIARKYTTRIFSRNWEGYGEQKNYATGLTKHDWILSLDADERLSTKLTEEIKKLMRNGPTFQGYRIPRTNHYLGSWIRSTDWHPDHQLRLYDRRVSTWNTRFVHESVSVKGRIGKLKGELLHYAYRDLSHHLSTIDRYTTLAAKQMAIENKRATWVRLLVHPMLVFLRNYVWRRGFLNGIPGLIISLMNSYYVLLKFVKLWENQQSNRNKK
jgi:glycosyltransferase involved in cell wall biosynthesis